MKETITQNIQDYLKTIYKLNEDGSAASTTALAARLGIAAASVTGMLQKLATATPPLVHYRKHQGATLTPDGKRAALEVIRHHRLLETYLVTMLGYTWDTVHEEACRLEHVISEEFEARIADALGHPQRDPHGEPIPSADLTMPTDTSHPLLELQPGQRAKILRVQANDSEFLRYANALGLVPGASVLAIARSPYDHNLTLQINHAESTVLGPGVTTQIFIEVNT